MKKTVIAATMAIIFGFISAVALCLQALSTQPVFSAADNEMLIVVDAGHGGIDGGVVGKRSKVKESQLNLDISFLLKAELEDMGFAVVLTRKTSEGLYDAATKGFKKRDMEKRKEIIRATSPSLLISVHQNYYPSQKSRGAQVFYARDNERGQTLAERVQARLNESYAKEGVKARKATGGEYFILQCCDAPSIIVECGFLSSPADEALLLTDGWKRQIAQDIAAGALAYFADFSA